MSLIKLLEKGFFRPKDVLFILFYVSFSVWQYGIGKFKSWSIREHSVEVGHLAHEGFVVNFVLLAEISELGFEMGAILVPLFLVFLHFLQQFLEGLL